MSLEHGSPTITIRDLDSQMLEALPELRSDVDPYRRQAGDPEFTQSFFSYSFVPTLQSALDRGVDEFCVRAFAFIEVLVSHGDTEVRELLDDEFFGYGPRCETWMRRAGCHMGPKTFTIAQQNTSRR